MQATQFIVDEAAVRADAGIEAPEPVRQVHRFGDSRAQRRANLANSLKSHAELHAKSPGMHRALRTKHNAICDALAAGKPAKAQELLRSMPAQYRGVVSLLWFYARTT